MNARSTEQPDTLLTIGHSNHTIDAFIALVKSAHIEALVDVRSNPFSKYAPHFDSPALKQAMLAHGVKYLFMGEALGGRPPEERFYDEEGRVLYMLVAETPRFLEGIARLERGMRNYRIALMCSEENPLDCHRRLLVGRVLLDRGINVCHIRGDGRIQTEEQLEIEATRRSDVFQLQLFSLQEAKPWKSTRSVLQRKQRNSSLEY